jgi:hypothetical protein
MFLDPKYIVGRKFTALDPNVEYTCIGYDNNGTSILFGVQFNSIDNRSKVRSFKVADVTFKGDLTTPTS